jgi:integrase/recombinase XerD
MAEDMRRRNYSTETQRAYVHYIAEYAKYFGVSPDQLGPEAIREYQLHLTYERKMSPSSTASPRRQSSSISDARAAME